MCIHGLPLQPSSCLSCDLITGLVCVGMTRDEAITMSDYPLMIRDDGARKIIWSPDALRVKSEALERSGIIGAVRNVGENQTATEALQMLHGIRLSVEAARKRCKEPVLEFGRLIDASAKTYMEAVDAEILRVSQIMEDFQMLEQSRIRAAKQAANDKLTEIERQRATEISQAKSAEQVIAIGERYSEAARAESEKAIPAAARAHGQRVGEDWKIEVTNIWEFAASYPTCCRPPEPIISEIKPLLDAGIKLPGIKAEKVIKIGVRAERERKAIEV